MDINICVTVGQWQFQKEKLYADLHNPNLYNLNLLGFIKGPSSLFWVTLISMAAQVSYD